MAESTTPSITRSPHKLEYTSSINTTLPSPTTTSTYHSSFDFISEPRDYDTTVFVDQDIANTSHRPLERDFPRLDLNFTQCKNENKNKKLDRTDSLSLPTTPIKQSPTSYDHKYHQLLLLKNDNDDDDEQRFSFKSPSDYMNAAPEQDIPQQIPDESISNTKRYRNMTLMIRI
jgi:hypothetical protein